MYLQSPESVSSAPNPPMPPTRAAAAAAAAAQPSLLNLSDLVPTLKPEGAGVDPAVRKRLWLQVRRSLLSLRDTITSEWEIHRSRPEELDFARIDGEMIRARRDAAESIFNMDKFLATAGRIVASLKKLAAKGGAVKRSWEVAIVSNGPLPPPPAPAAVYDEEMCGLKKVRRELDQVKMSRDKLLQELTLLAGKKKRLEEEFVKLREEIKITKQELFEGY